MKYNVSNLRLTDTSMIASIAILFIVFALFIHQKNPTVFVSFLSLSIIGILIFFSSIKSPATSFRLSNYKKIHYTITGILIGIILALSYKVGFKYDLFSLNISHITFIVFSIGVTEELIFRGFMQTKISVLNKFAGVILSSVAHTSYKTAIFLLPPALDLQGFIFLSVFTFSGGIIFGILTEISDNVIPASIAHGIFDIIVYGSLTTLPWWVV